MSSLISNVPLPAQKNCGGCSGNCDCSKHDPENFGDVFKENALFMISKTDNICEMAEKINANFKMLTDGYLLLARAFQLQKIRFGPLSPTGFIGNFFYNTTSHKLFIWNESTTKYISVYGDNSIDEVGETLAEDYTPENIIPTLAELRNIYEGVALNNFQNTFGEMVITFVNTTPNCSVGLFIYDKSKCVLKVWSPEDNEYKPAFSQLTVENPFETKPTTTGEVYQTVISDK